MSDRYRQGVPVEYWDLQTVAGARAVVLGMGALGNEVAKNLALLGWGRIVIVDRDVVETGNLGRSVLFRAEDIGESKAERAATALAGINPDCRINALTGDMRVAVGAGLLRRADVIFGCLDNVPARIAAAQLAGQAGSLFVDGGLTTAEGTVRSYLPVGASPCYVCTLTENDLHHVRLGYSCSVYQARAAQVRGVPTTPTVASATGALMVQQALRWTHRQVLGSTFEVGREIRIDLLHDRFWNIELPYNPECVLHPVQPELMEISDLSWSDSWLDILDSWRDRWGTADLTLRVPTYVLQGSTCPQCGARTSEARAHPGDLDLACRVCGSVLALDIVNQFTGAESWGNRSPAETGLPPWSWLEVASTQRMAVFELAGTSAALSDWV